MVDGDIKMFHYDTEDGKKHTKYTVIHRKSTFLYFPPLDICNTLNLIYILSLHLILATLF